MIADLKPYAEYKESGLPWLGQVPRAWRVVRNGSLFGQRNQTGYEELPILEVSLKTGVRVRDFENSTRKQVMSDIGKYKRAAKGDVAYNMMRMWQGAVGVSPVDGLVSPAYVVARPYPQVEPRFFVALFRTGDYMSEIDNCSRGIVKDRNRLYWDQFKQILSPCPPPAEQAAIVRFLDWANGRLERAIRAKRKVIALLTEQKQAIIHRAVTRGLDPSVPLKPSGLPWLGDMPRHWEVSRVKNLARSGYKTFVDGDWIESPYIRERGVRLIQTGNIGIGVYREKGFRYISEETFSAFGCTEILPNDVLICRLGEPVGRACLAPTLGVRMITSVDVCILKPRDAVDPAFTVFLMTAPGYLKWVGSLVRGSTRDRVSRSMLAGFTLPLPPLEEQVTIVRHLTVACGAVNTAISRLEREIELLREYRTRLVADVVTGKLDVREAAARLPDEVASDTAEDDTDPSIDPEADDEEAAV
jgi:type I restriction enzyme S subunit